jgi:hypothetical protein
VYCRERRGGMRIDQRGHVSPDSGSANAAPRLGLGKQLA